MNKKTTVIKLLPFLAVGISAVFYFFIPESGKVVVMSARPSKVEAVIDIDLPKPRIRIQDTFALYRNKILSILNLGGKVQEAQHLKKTQDERVVQTVRLLSFTGSQTCLRTGS